MPRSRADYTETDEHLVMNSVVTTPHIQVHMRLHLPAYLMPSYWTRHELTSENVATLLHNTDTLEVWLLAIATGSAEPAPSCLKLGFASSRDILIGSRAATVRKVLEKFEPILAPFQFSRLEPKQWFCFRDPLVRHFISQEKIEFLKQNLLPCFDLFNIVQTQPLFCFRNQQWIAVAVDGDVVLAACVVPLEIYERALHDDGAFNSSGHVSHKEIVNRGKLFIHTLENNTYHKHIVMLDNMLLFMPGFC